MTQDFDMIGPSAAPRTWRDAVAPGVAALIAFVLLSLFPHPLIHPSVCEDVAIAAGLRPPVTVFPGIYRLVATLLLHAFPADAALDLLRLLGRLGVALATAGVYFVFRDILPDVFQMRVHMRRIGRRVGAVVAALAALLFLFADPVWRAGQFLSPITVFLCLTIAAVALFFRFLRAGSVWSLYGCFALLAILSAETMLGFLFTACGVAGMFAAMRHAARSDVPLVNPLVDRLVCVVVFRRLMSVWAGFFLLAIAQNVTLFISAGGMEATGQDGVPGLLFAYLKGGCDGVFAAATGPGWIMGLLFSVSPFLFSVALLQRAWDDERFLPYVVGIVYLAIAAVALSQLSGVDVLKFWTWFGGIRPMIASELLLTFFLLLDVAAVAFSLSVFGVDACCRDYRRIAHRLFPDSVQLETPAQFAESIGRSRRFRRSLFWFVTVLVSAVALLGRWRLPERAVERIVCDYLDEVLKEAEGCDTIFTDGSFDTYLELEAMRRGRTLYGLSLLAPNTAREKMVRLRAAENEEDRVTLANDSVSALRSWIDSRSKRLDRTAIQLGFELWQKANIPLPPLSGLVALPGGVEETERERALSVCQALVDRANALATEKSRLQSIDPAIKSAFSFVLWRLARLSRMRSRVADGAGRRADALREAEVADELDAINPHVQSLRGDTVWQKRQRGSGVLTPREGLVIGLARADFSLAGRYAAPVLAADPDEPRANFAMGMMHYTDEQYARAEPYLLRCLVRRPDDAAVLNNLALVQMKIGKIDEAEANAAKAAAKWPDIPEVRHTLEKIREKKSKAGTNELERSS